MKKIPVVFSIDRNVIVPFVVCSTSLLRHAAPDTFYELFVLHNAAGLDAGARDLAKGAVAEYAEKCSLKFLDVGEMFADAFEIRGITIASYYRLLIPRLLPDYDRVIYADVDIVFRSDLSELFDKSLANEELVAGVREVNAYNKAKSVLKLHRYYEEIGCDVATYINAGVLVLNLKAMRDEGIVDEFIKHAGRKYLTQDQDIMNIVCRGRIELLPLKWNYTYLLYRWAHQLRGFAAAYAEEIPEAERVGTVHYTGPKPWSGFCLRADLWWENYRNSSAFDADVYYAWQQRHDHLCAQGNKREKWTRLWQWLRIGKA